MILGRLSGEYCDVGNHWVLGSVDWSIALLIMETIKEFDYISIVDNVQFTVYSGHHPGVQNGFPHTEGMVLLPLQNFFVPQKGIHILKISKNCTLCDFFNIKLLCDFQFHVDVYHPSLGRLGSK